MERGIDMHRRWWWLPIVAIALGVLGYLYLPRGYCRSAEERYGLRLPRCPDGIVRQVVRLQVRDLSRGGGGTVRVSPEARYAVSKADEELEAPVVNFKPSLALVDAAGEETVLKPEKKWTRSDDDGLEGEVILPEVPDGDYILRATVRSKVGESTLDMELPLYSPAQVHVLSDRPIYEPGNTVQFRALALRARDLTPIDNRPGTWLVQNPQGEVLLEERSPAGEWGVAQGTFPLGKDAEEGQWSVTWRSGDDEGTVHFNVVPFTLPRFRVEAEADKRFYGAGETPRLSGTVTYSSGAPVSGATVEAQWSSSGDWPPPAEWMAGGLPRQVIASESGTFELVLPEIPQDLIGRATLHATLAAVDPAGDRVSGSAQVSLSADPIEVSLVTEFGGGLVSNSNNRVFLRVTRADGTVLSGARVNVKKAWAPGDEGIDIELDEDGVGRLQMDPGRPVNVVIPAMPVRRTIDASAGRASITGLDELVSREEPPMADRIELDRWLASLSSCAKWVQGGSASTQVALRVSTAGAIGHAAPDGTALGRCVAGALRKRRFPPGPDRLYRLQLTVQAPDLPTLSGDLSQTSPIPPGLAELVAEASLDARDCLPGNVQGELPAVLMWRTTVGSQKVTVEWMKNPAAEGAMDPALARCIASRVSSRTLPKNAVDSRIGLVRYRLSQPGAEEELAPQPTIMQGYELLVSAAMGEEEIGQARVRVEPGSVPPLRLRATPSVARPGDTIELALLRSSEHTGDLPDEIYVTHEGESDDIEVEDKKNKASFEIPEDVDGWYTFEAHDARALVFVQTGEPLSLELAPGARRYAPGAEARIDVETRLSGKGTKAAVGLFGVDESLAQLAPLLGPEELESLQPEVEMTAPAFGALDAQALTLGRIRGAYAAEATILQVATVPTVADLDVQINKTETAEFDAVAELTDNFYIVLAELYEQARQWERSAEEGEQMTPPKMAKLWKKAIKACEKRGEKVVDAYGRRLRLHRLPSDLLALTDPAQVVADAARLPEDTEPWEPWVEEERP